jgi:hypothetical protein
MSFSNIADICVIMTTVFVVFSLMVIAFIAICINAKKKAFIAGWNGAYKNFREWYKVQQLICLNNCCIHRVPVATPASVV